MCRILQVFVPFLGNLFSIIFQKEKRKNHESVFVPFLGNLFSINSLKVEIYGYKAVFVPFLGNLFSIACLRSPSPSALASAFAAGMGESLHQALSFGDEMPISPGRTGIGGDLQ